MGCQALAARAFPTELESQLTGPGLVLASGTRADGNTGRRGTRTKTSVRVKLVLPFVARVVVAVALPSISTSRLIANRTRIPFRPRTQTRTRGRSGARTRAHDRPHLPHLGLRTGRTPLARAHRPASQRRCTARNPRTTRGSTPPRRSGPPCSCLP